jgi:hypothetical protein
MNTALGLSLHPPARAVREGTPACMGPRLAAAPPWWRRRQLRSRSGSQRRVPGVSCTADVTSSTAPSASAKASRAPPNQQAPQRPGRAERESLQLLEWPALCRQVACFAQTPIAAEVALGGRLPLGASRGESESLLQQTREAAGAHLDFAGTFDLRRAVDAAEAGQVLHSLVLSAVATTLAAARELHGACTAATPELQQLAAGIAGGLPALQDAIDACIQVGACGAAARHHAPRPSPRFLWNKHSALCSRASGTAGAAGGRRARRGRRQPAARERAGCAPREPAAAAPHL